mgnify:CR=1 FL=1
MILDGLILGLCLWFCHFLRSSELVHFEPLQGKIPPFSDFYWMLAMVIPVTPLLLDLQGYYDSPLSQRFEDTLFKMGKAGFWLALLLGLAAIFGRLEMPSRTVLLLFFILAPLFLLLRAWITKKFLVRNYRKGRLGERTVVIGSLPDGERFINGLTAGERLELQITQRIDLDRNDPQQISKTVHQHAAGRVIFVSPDSPRNGDLPSFFENEGIEVWIIKETINGITSTPIIRRYGGIRALIFRRTRHGLWHDLIKRTIDLLGASLGLLLLSPVWIAIAIAIKKTSPGPIIFSQVRSGKHGRRFTILKFRTMIPNAPALHASLAHQNEMQGPVFKIARDPRVTPLGEFLRKTSLDEIPQLLNVLRGEMSIVGPRPLPDYETERIEKSTHRRRLSVKPGLTCLWQVKGRNAIQSFDDWVKLDLEYIDRASLLLDFSIMLATVPAVLLRKGAR